MPYNLEDTSMIIAQVLAHSWRHQITGRPVKKRSYENYCKWRDWNLDWERLSDAATAARGGKITRDQTNE